MVGSSKILTVSYGTFSCTLEGFDDPFSTMKAIAEYFRNLAADDRYFGAEPPTPDAAMLHQIAERAIQKKVEAQVEENAVTLRQAAEAATDIDSAETAEMMELLNAGVDEPAQTAAEMLAEPVGDTSSDDVREEADPEAESAAEKLARLRALVSLAEEEAYTEDEHAEEASDTDVKTAVIESEPEALANAGTATDEEPVEIAAPLEELIAEQSALADEDAAALQDVAEEDAEETPPTEDQAQEGVTEEDEDDGFDLDSLTAALADDDPQEAAAPLTADETAPSDAPAEPSAEADPAQMPVAAAVTDVAETSEPLPEAEEVAETRPRVRRVRVIKARKSDLAERGGDAADLPKVKRPVEVPQTDEAAVARLMDATDDEMNGDETRRRQDGFALAKAAVAAARADTTETDEDTLKSASAAYRQDLDAVVRPGARSGGKRLAPLVLVSEQRVDADQAAVAQAATDGNLALAEAPHDDAATALDDATSFSDFAESVGAIEMNDLLEAAAAYVSHVEGRVEFTRPVIMRHVEAACGPEDFSREEGLRSFGTLLRNGTIRKLKRGKFQIADTNRFADEARAVGE